MGEGKVHFKHCMLFEFQKGNNTMEAKRNLFDVFGEVAVTARTCQRWLVKFRLYDFLLKMNPNLEDHQMSVMSATQNDQGKSSINFHRNGHQAWNSSDCGNPTGFQSGH
ncbi:hypothetical protein TNCV_2592541 [Trichonephila clavipes]|nr:hypothetical protein TNCV_2592541 [Trichonephila clavipes]